MSNPILRAHDLGQSIWFDDLHRGLIDSGRLAEMVQHEGLCGVTSNPSIFEKAIAESSRYDAAIGKLVAAGLNKAADIYERLAVADIQAAADVLRPVYERSGGGDGFVSLEVAPTLAHDTDGTVAEARRLARAVDRSNLLVKVPATRAGIQAIERLVSEGINVNATLIFALEAYAEVAQAYLRGLERRETGVQARAAGVASFFVSRIDSAVDARLNAAIEAAADERTREELRRLLGRVAIANAKLAYRHYRELLATPRWQALARHGAHPQRLLWASTGTKNPAYSKTLYVDQLIGPDTVNTAPEQTYLEFLRHGQVRPTLAEGVDEAEEVFSRLAEARISMKAVTDMLLGDGVRLFTEAYERLLAAIERKRLSCSGAAAA